MWFRRAERAKDGMQVRRKTRGIDRNGLKESALRWRNLSTVEMTPA